MWNVKCGNPPVHPVRKVWRVWKVREVWKVRKVRKVREVREVWKVRKMREVWKVAGRGFIPRRAPTTRPTGRAGSNPEPRGPSPGVSHFAFLRMGILSAMIRTDADPIVVLASGSPRRRELLELIGLRFEIHPADIDEHRHPGEGAAEFAQRAAADKAAAVASGYASLPVLGSDTVVAIDGEVLGKPQDEKDARRMLRLLAGRTHHVHTGMAVHVDGRSASLVDSTAVTFHPLTDEMIDWYLSTPEPMDKAGAYAVQGRGGVLVAAIDGSPHTVVGLPIHRLAELFGKVGIDLWNLLES
jgi:septum formation protein